MRRFAVGLGIGGALLGAWIIAQPQPPGTTGELQFPKLSTPYTCSDGRAGRVYYDTDDFLPYYCDDNADVWTKFGVNISGTDNYLARFNAAGDNIEDSDLRNSGVPAAGASGSILDLTSSLNAMDGSDTTSGLFIDFTNASHTGSSNLLYGVSIDTLVPSANASEYAISIASGWDRGISMVGPDSGDQGLFISAGAGTAIYTTAGGFQLSGQFPSAGTSGQILALTGTVNAMNGSDTVKVISCCPNNANHTGTSNTYAGIGLSINSPDAEADETAILIGSSGETNNWDRDITFLNDDNHTHFYFEGGTAGVRVQFDGADSTPDLLFRGNGTVQTSIIGGREFGHVMGTDLTVVGSNQTVNPDANVVEITASSAASVSTITAHTQTNHTERVTFICANTNVTFNDADAAGAAGTINLAGAATNFTCSADDTLTVVYMVSPASGNARWVEVSRSVN